MRTQKIVVFSMIGLLFLLACNQTSEQHIGNNYFDLKNYFLTEAGIYNSLHDKARKTLLKESHSETKSFDITDWVDELTPFIESDINKPSWKNSFTIDSITDGSKVQISYRCIDKSVPVKKVIIEKTNQWVSKINIETEKENMFYKAQSSLEYIALQGYTVKNRQKSFLSDPDEFELKVIFIK